MHKRQRTELAPAILFVYNRPWHTRQTVEALRKNELSSLTDLVVFADGPKDESAVEAVNDVHDYLRSIDGFKSVTIIESERNKGLADSVIAGVTEVISKHGRVIVLEDDLVTAPGFLRYMNQALGRYQNDEKVMQVSGHMFDVEIDAETDAVFLPFTTSWGWATWKSAWKHFDPLMIGAESLSKDRKLRRRFNLDGSYDYFSMLKAQKKGKIDSWAIRWYWSVFVRHGMTIFPVKSLVENIGFDGSGTHCGISAASSMCTGLWAGCDEGEMRLPNISTNKDAYDKVKGHLASSCRFLTRLRFLLDDWVSVC